MRNNYMVKFAEDKFDPFPVRASSSWRAALKFALDGLEGAVIYVWTLEEWNRDKDRPSPREYTVGMNV